MISRITRKSFLLLLILVILYMSFLLFNYSKNEKEAVNLKQDEIANSEGLVNYEGDDATVDETPVMSDEELEELAEVLTQDPKLLATQEALERPLPFDGIEGFNLEFMNEEERLEFEIPFKREAQILTRDFEGNITSYKLIKQAEDIIYPN